MDFNGFDLSTISNAFYGSTQVNSIWLGSTKIWPSGPPDYSRAYLPITSLEANNLIGWDTTSGFGRNISVSTDNGTTWTTIYSSGAALATLNNGDKLLIKGSNTRYADILRDNYYYCFFTSTGNYDIEGNIMSLIYGDNFINQYSLSSNSNFSNLFHGSAHLINANNLVLPATTITDSCYEDMFENCTSLITTPTILPATTLAEGCYRGMFRYCSSLTTTPELPATTLANYCYNDMFGWCTNLISIPILSATTLTEGCYAEMFYNCSSLTTAPTLPATTLAQRCYSNMFYGCRNLTTAPELPATTLYTSCYKSMFEGCSSLTTAPTVLPANTLVDSCYYKMFYGCRNLTTAPELLATNLAVNLCVANMFYNCSSLNYIKCLATYLGSAVSRTDWVYGVAATGTFVKDANMTSWTTGTDGIPSGWNVEDYVDYSQEYFTIKSTSNNNQIYFCTNDTSFINTIQISTNKKSWINKTPGSYSKNISLGTLNNGNKLYIRATNSRYATSSYVYHYFTFTGNFEVEGNIMSLVYGANFTGQTVLNDSYNFCKLFYNNTYLINAKNLILPATNLTNYCYYYMFSGCTALTKSPESLPATTLPTNCYEDMFSGCTSLTTTPEIMATSTALSLRNMFLGCRALTTVPDLHLTTLAGQCCQQMFANCSSLTKAPALPATTLANWCYQNMFSGCISLTTAPELPATTLMNGCYQYMFNSCASLTTAPELPATILANNCYKSMFNGCTSLNYIKCLATDISATTPTTNWLNNVAATGTFIKDANMTSWTTGVDGIPSGWTCLNA